MFNMTQDAEVVHVLKIMFFVGEGVKSITATCQISQQVEPWLCRVKKYTFQK